MDIFRKKNFSVNYLKLSRLKMFRIGIYKLLSSILKINLSEYIIAYFVFNLIKKFNEVENLRWQI
jgi:hypothetical protein